MKKQFSLLALLLTLAFPQNSKAGLFIEPALTYETGDTSTTYPSPFSSSSGKVEGFGIGARLGFHIDEAFFLALDARYSMPQFKDSSVGYDAKSVATNWGPVVGLQMPNLGLRVWGSYILGGQLDPEKSGSIDVKMENGTGYRVGLGFRIASVSLNAEYQSMKYDKASLEQVGPFAPGTSFSGVNYENKSWIASLSFPIEM